MDLNVRSSFSDNTLAITDYANACNENILSLHMFEMCTTGSAWPCSYYIRNGNENNDVSSTLCASLIMPLQADGPFKWSSTRAAYVKERYILSLKMI